jgi:hypothetical protein
MHLPDDAPCPCGSRKPAGSCCIRMWNVHKSDGRVVRERALVLPQADPSPPEPRTAKVVDGCYAAPLLDCDGSLTGEHFISHRMLKLLEGTPGKNLRVRGIDPKNPTDERRVSPAKVIAPVLCSPPSEPRARLLDGGEARHAPTSRGGGRGSLARLPP